MQSLVHWKRPEARTRTLAMAAVTPEDLTALRTQIAQLQESQAELRDEVDVLKSSEAGLHAALEDLQNAAATEPAGERLKNVEEQLALVPTSEEFLQHLDLMDTKLKEDLDKVKAQQDDLEGKLAAVKSTALTLREPQAFVASASQHLTQRRGFDGLSDYGGGHYGPNGGSPLSRGSGRNTGGSSLSSRGSRG